MRVDKGEGGGDGCSRHQHGPHDTRRREPAPEGNEHQYATDHHRQNPAATESENRQGTLGNREHQGPDEDQQ